MTQDTKDELKNLIVYTGVYYQDDATYRARSKIWFKTFDNAQGLGIKVVVRNDGGLPPEMLERIKAYPNITIVENMSLTETDPLKRDKLGKGRRDALQKAIEIAGTEGIKHPIFLWTEPEKDDLITTKSLLPMIAEIRAGSNIVVAERKEEAWEQLPPFQHGMEKRANKRANQTIPKEIRPSKELDIWFAPRVFDETGAKYFLDYNSAKDRLDLWDAIHVPVMDAIKDGVKVKGIPVDFLYNQIQIENESDESNREIQIKRIEQYAQILAALGDRKWIEFFESSKEELARVKELRKGNPKLDDEPWRKARQSLVKKFFPMK